VFFQDSPIKIYNCKGISTERSGLRMHQFQIIKQILFSACIATAFGIISCQTDGRTSTRIPPKVNKTKVQWQEDAIASLTNQINRNIDVDMSYFKRSRIYFEQEEYKKALSDIESAIEEKNNIGEYYLLKGKINRELGNIDMALQDAERSEALQQKSPDLYILIADILQEKKQYKEAEKYLSQSMMIAPYDGAAYYVKAMLLARQGDTLASLENIHRATELNPRLLRAFRQGTNLHLKMKQTDLALQLNATAIQRFPQIADLYSERGDIFRALARPDTAIFLYEKAVGLNPNATKPLLKLINLNLELRAYNQALNGLTKLQKANPTYDHINYLIGYCYEKLGDYPKAREYYNISITLNPTDQQTRYGLWRVRPQSERYNAEDDDLDQHTGRDYNRDSTRFKIDLLKPRTTTNLRSDSLGKAKIQ
jgi:tetratricopeptide (TPR) repeat protein